MLGEEGRAFLESKRALIDRVLKKFGLSPEESASFVELLNPLLTDDDCLLLRTIRSDKAFVRYLVRAIETARRAMTDPFPRPVTAPVRLNASGIVNAVQVNVTCRAQIIGSAMLWCGEGVARGFFKPRQTFACILPWLKRSTAYRAVEYSDLLSPRDVREGSVLEGWSGGRLAIEAHISCELPTTRLFFLDRPEVTPAGGLILVADFKAWQGAPFWK